MRWFCFFFSPVITLRLFTVCKRFSLYSLTHWNYHCDTELICVCITKRRSSVMNEYGLVNFVCTRTQKSISIYHTIMLCPFRVQQISVASFAYSSHKFRINGIWLYGKKFHQTFLCDIETKVFGRGGER